MSAQTYTNSLKVALILSAFTVSYVHAATEPADATATVVTTLSITKVDDLVFGNVAPGATGGTVVMSPAGVRSTTGDAVTYTSTNNAASFTVSGSASATYSITLPSSPVTITGLNPSNTMNVTAFSSTPSTTGTLDGSGNQTLNVGATLTVANGQAADSYSGSFNVTVDYN